MGHLAPYTLFLPRPGRREINRTKDKEYLSDYCPNIYTVVEPISYFRLKVRRSTLLRSIGIV